MLSLIVGLISGFEILGSAAYGAKKFDLIGIYLWKARIVGYSVAVVVLLTLYFSFEYIMEAAGNSELEIRYGIRFTKAYIFGILFEVLFRTNFVYINIAEKSYVNTIIVLVNLCVFTVVCYLLIFIAELDTLGAGLSILIGQALNAIVTTLYIAIYEPIPNTIFFINKKCFKDLWSYLRISLPSTLLLCSEWWSFEILAIFSIMSKCYTEHVLVYNIYVNLCSFICGFATSTTIMCSSAMGEKDHLKAKRFYKYNFFFCFFLQSSIAILFASLNKHIVRLFTKDEFQTEKVEEVVYVLSVLTIFDATQYIINCFAKSCGKMWSTTAICISVLYGIQTLCAFLFSYEFNYGLIGIWLSCVGSLLILNISYLTLVCFIDYEKAVVEITNNLEEDKKKLDEIIQAGIEED